MSENINKIFAFIVEIDKLKNVLRKTRPVGLDRYENSGEHSWHVCLSALMLKDYSNESIDINHVIKMLLIHDLGEIDAGDTMIYEENMHKAKLKEREGIKRIFGLLPSENSAEYIALWEEFEFEDTAEARFARAIDRIPPVLHNLHGDLHSWQDNNIPMEKVLHVNSSIQHGSKKLWEVIESRLNEVAANAILPQSNNKPVQPGG
ncbi:MAG: HD domain-containing protein [Gammaproteobacteria bacterium]|nr:HD domain-containing protein [Gammaproteobacteria bacterium]